MRANGLVFAAANELAARIRHRAIGCVELMEAYLSRMERCNGPINAVCVLDAERARAAARRADDLPADAIERNGPLFGVPMTVKESFDVAGLATTWGMPEHRDNIATTDALAVARLKSAGAIVFGKTNVPRWLADWQTFNPIYGTTRNPWNLTRTPGGSSGGSAAALAAGLTGLEIGSDIGASIRNPAHYCGVYGHKPTYDICASDGHRLPGQYSQADLAVIGPMARSAADLRIALAVIAGPSPQRARGWKLELPREGRRRIGEYRIGVLATHPTAEVDAAVVDAIAKLTDFLRRAGATVEENAQPEFDLDEVHKLYIRLLRSATSGQAPLEKFAELQRIAPTLAPSNQSYFAQHVRANTLLHRDWLEAHNRRNQLSLAWQPFFDRFDVLLCPVAATTAFEHNQDGERWERMIDVNGRPQPTTTQLFWAGLPTLFGLPSTVAPIGLADDALPVGVQIIAPAFGDHRSIAFAELLEAKYCRFAPPRGFE